MGRKIFQGIVIFMAMVLFWSSGPLTEATAGAVKPEEFPQVVQLPSTGNRKLFYPPLNDENDLEGTQKIETGSTPEPEPEQNEEEAKNDLEASSAPVLEEPVEIIETPMNAVSAKLRYYPYRSDWGGIQILLWVAWWILILSYSCYYCYYYYHRPAETLVGVLVVPDRTGEGENLDSTQV